MKNEISRLAQGNTCKVLHHWWLTQCQQNEEISRRRWQRNRRWLNTYEENFSREHKDNNPYFKLKIDENETRTSRNTHHMQQVTKRTQPGNNKIHNEPNPTRTHDNQTNGRPQRTARRETTKNIPNKLLNSRKKFNYLQDSDDEELHNDFLEESASTETLT